MKKVSLILFCLLGMFGMAFTNFIVLDRILIPDPCKYHTASTTMLFDLFYVIKSAEGFHPAPSLFNYLFTIGVGIFIGYWVFKLFYQKNIKRLA